MIYYLEKENKEYIIMRARHIHLHHRTENKLLRLKNEAEVDGEYRVAKRIHAVMLNNDGKTSGEIAHILRSVRQRVSEWLKNYERFGFEGILEGKRSGRRPDLDEVQKQIVVDIIESGPISYGFLSGIWTGVAVNKVIENEFGVSYDPRHVRRILSELGFSVQRPKRLLAKADPERQKRWRRYTYPNLKKKQKMKELL